MFKSRWLAGLLVGSCFAPCVACGLEPIASAPAPAAMVPRSAVFQRVYPVPVSSAAVPARTPAPRAVQDVKPPILGTAPPATPVQPSIVPPFPAIGSGVPAYAFQDIPIQTPPGYEWSAGPTIQYMPHGQTLLSDSINHPQTASGGFGGGCSSCAESTYAGRYPHVHWISSKVYRAIVYGPQYPCGSDGCTSPLGCNNLHSAAAFAFGSCRTFFGNQASAPSHLNR